MYNCFKCGRSWESTLRQPAVKETCDGCGSYLHCCRNCTHHRAGYPNECYIPDTEKVANKTLTNFCDEFDFVSAETLESRKRGNRQSDHLSESLLGESSEPENLESDVKNWLVTSDKLEKDFTDLFED
tara:strand:- start:990 stop:1373 length:384 start_codon:yes stop_codon:yes gene_type:complete